MSEWVTDVDPRAARFPVSARVGAWARKRGDRQFRPSDVPPPCVGCGDDARQSGAQSRQIAARSRGNSATDGPQTDTEARQIPRERA